MTRSFSNNSIFLFGIFLLLGLGGCASVESTAIYYEPTTLEQYPPKPEDWPIPILGKAPKEPYKQIGRLAFTSDQGYRFMRKSIEYNARVNGADAVILRNVDQQTRVFLTQVPPSWDYVPYTAYYPANGWRGGYGHGDGYCRGGGWVPVTNWVPLYQPGYVQANEQTMTSIDAEMIVITGKRR